MVDVVQSDEKALEEFARIFRQYHQDLRAGLSPSRTEIDKYLKRGIVGIDEVAAAVEKDFHTPAADY